MTAASYSDYALELKGTLDDLMERPERYQTFALHAELAMKGNLLVLEATRRKAQTDMIAYARVKEATTQVSPQSAFHRLSSFLTMQHHIALSGEPMLDLPDEYPHAVITLELRARGAALRSSMKMIFVGVDDYDDAARYADLLGDIRAVVTSRPHRSSKLWEWK